MKSLPRMRTINQAADYLKEQDSETAFTTTALRRLIVTGTLPSVRVGNKYLVSLEVLDDFLSNGNTPEKHEQQAPGTIRPINP